MNIHKHAPDITGRLLDNPDYAYKWLAELQADEALATLDYIDGALVRKDSGQKAALPNKDGYTYVTLCDLPVREARVIWLLHTGRWPAAQIDHIDRNPRNNRVANLRPASTRQNQWNKGPRRDNRLQLKGVTRYAGPLKKYIGKYEARINYDGVHTCLGYYNTKAEAAAAYNAAAKELHGEFAYQNPIRKART